MLEIRVLDQLPFSRTIKLDSEGPKVKPQGPGEPTEAIEQLYVSKSDMRYKKTRKIAKSCPLRGSD